MKFGDLLTASDTPPVVLFDGVCNLCNGTINFLIDRDPRARLRFAALQSEAGRALLADLEHPSNLDTFLLVEGSRLSERSSAALRVVRYLPWYWQPLRALWLVPKPLRDAVYRWVARNRYRWFGTREACRVPTPALRARFL